ncbi:MAG TPA: hypothetical protein VGL62_03210 [Vicinamibacterales bacterium]
MTMRRGLASLGFAAVIMLALSAIASAVTSSAPADTPDQPTVAVQQVPVPVPGLRDEAAMVLVGTALIGLAAAVKRAA